MKNYGATLPPPHMRRPALRRAQRTPLPDDEALVAAALDSAPFGLLVLDDSLAVRMLTASAAKLLDCGAVHPVRSAVADLLAQSRALAPAASQLLMSALERVRADDGHSARSSPSSQDQLAQSDDPSPRAAPADGVEAREAAITVQTNAGGTLSVDIRAAGRLGWVLSLSDVTQTRATQDWLLEHVSSDPVTGLWNRQHFLLMLDDALSHAGDALPCAVLIGLDRLRPASDPGFLHAADMLLRMASERVSALLGDGDMIARFSETEFAVALTRPGGRAETEGFCKRVHEALSRPFLLDSHVVLLGCHVGAADAPDDASSQGASSDGASASRGSGEHLMAHARLALDAACAASSEPIRFYDPELLQRAQQRRCFEADLRCALHKGEFELHYQPQVDLTRGRVTGLEALIRWRSPERGLVSPAEFIPMAEQIGMIDEVGAWVLHQACLQAASWPDGMTVAVNASPLQFETGRFAQTVADVLQATHLPPHRLELEVTENLLLQDTGEVMGTLAALRDLGVRLVLDDFGTGYASLSQLSRFRFDKIKIDRSFVSPDGASRQNSVIVRSVAALGSGLGIPITAEGVETATQLDQIKADGCTCVQGYYFSRPVPADDIGPLLARLHRPATLPC